MTCGFDPHPIRLCCWRTGTGCPVRADVRGQLHGSRLNSGQWQISAGTGKVPNPARTRGQLDGWGFDYSACLVESIRPDKGPVLKTGAL